MKPGLSVPEKENTKHAFSLFRGTLLRRGVFYPFTAPTVKPFTKYFWKKG